MPTTTQRGLGHQHQKRRKQLLTHAHGTPCALCGVVMRPGDHLDLDHSTPRVLGGKVGDRIVHRHCNRSAGAKLGNALRGARRRQAMPSMPRSRQW